MGKRSWLGAFAIAGVVALDQRERASLARRSTLLQTRLGAVEAEITGKGQAVLVLHGTGGGFDQGTWLAHVLGLGERRVIAISRPGYLRTPDAETLEDAADLSVAALDALGLEQAAVIAGSGGGPTACVLAARHADRISRLVMLSAVSGPVTSGRAALTVLVGATGDLARATVSALRVPSQRRSLREFVRTLAAPDRRVAGARRDLAIARGFVALPPIAIPTLIIHGLSDRAVPFAHAERTAAACIRGTLVPIAGGTHLCCLTHAEVGERVRAFLAN